MNADKETFPGGEHLAYHVVDDDNRELACYKFRAVDGQMELLRMTCESEFRPIMAHIMETLSQENCAILKFDKMRSKRVFRRLLYRYLYGADFISKDIVRVAKILSPSTNELKTSKTKDTLDMLLGNAPSEDKRLSMRRLHKSGNSRVKTLKSGDELLGFYAADNSHISGIPRLVQMDLPSESKVHFCIMMNDLLSAYDGIGGEMEIYCNLLSVDDNMLKFSKFIKDTGEQDLIYGLAKFANYNGA